MTSATLRRAARLSSRARSLPTGISSSRRATACLRCSQLLRLLAPSGVLWSRKCSRAQPRLTPSWSPASRRFTRRFRPRRSALTLLTSACPTPWPPWSSSTPLGWWTRQGLGIVAGAAREAGALVVEDSAHCVGRMARGADGAPLADISVHSFGAEKMLPTKFGGAIWVNPDMADRELHAAITAALTSLPAPGPRLKLAARTYRWTRKVVSRVPSVGRALEKTQLYSPAVAQAEREGRLAHGAVGASGWVVDEARRSSYRTHRDRGQASGGHRRLLGRPWRGLRRPAARALPALVPRARTRSRDHQVTCAPKASTPAPGIARALFPASRTHANTAMCQVRCP